MHSHKKRSMQCSILSMVGQNPVASHKQGVMVVSTPHCWSPLPPPEIAIQRYTDYGHINFILVVTLLLVFTSHECTFPFFLVFSTSPLHPLWPCFASCQFISILAQFSESQKVTDLFIGPKLDPIKMTIIILCVPHIFPWTGKCLKDKIDLALSVQF